MELESSFIDQKTSKLLLIQSLGKLLLIAMKKVKTGMESLATSLQATKNVEQMYVLSISKPCQKFTQSLGSMTMKQGLSFG